MCLFGDIVDGEMLLNDFGRVAHEVRERIPAHFAMVETDAWIVVPNHVHGVIFIAGPDTGGVAERRDERRRGGGTAAHRGDACVAPATSARSAEAFPWRGDRLLQVGRVEANQRIGVVSPYVGVATQLP